jgi:cytochrome b involved in lipid metabolism
MGVEADDVVHMASKKPQTIQRPNAPYIKMAEVARHHLAHDAWVVVDGKVYE